MPRRANWQGVNVKFGGDSGSELEQFFVEVWRLHAPKDLPPYQREFKFSSVRRWRVDFAWVEQRVAVELEGGVYTGGRHTQATGFMKDCEKYNTLVLYGWRLLRFPSPQVKNDPMHVIAVIATALRQPVPPQPHLQMSEIPDVLDRSY